MDSWVKVITQNIYIAKVSGYEKWDASKPKLFSRFYTYTSCTWCLGSFVCWPFLVWPTSVIILTIIRSVPRTNSSSFTSFAASRNFTQSSLVRPYVYLFTWLIIRLFVQVILSPSFESKFEFAHHCSRRRLQICQYINHFFLVYWKAWLTAFCR